MFLLPLVFLFLRAVLCSQPFSNIIYDKIDINPRSGVLKDNKPLEIRETVEHDKLTHQQTKNQLSFNYLISSLANSEINNDKLELMNEKFFESQLESGLKVWGQDESNNSTALHLVDDNVTNTSSYNVSNLQTISINFKNKTSKARVCLFLGVSYLDAHGCVAFLTLVAYFIIVALVLVMTIILKSSYCSEEKRLANRIIEKLAIFKKKKLRNDPVSYYV